jgi:hypothetical protein
LSNFNHAKRGSHRRKTSYVELTHGPSQNKLIKWPLPPRPRQPFLTTNFCQRFSNIVSASESLAHFSESPVSTIYNGERIRSVSWLILRGGLPVKTFRSTNSHGPSTVTPTALNRLWSTDLRSRKLAVGIWHSTMNQKPRS